MHFARRAFEFPKPLSQALCKAIWGRDPQAKQLQQMGLKLQELWPLLAKNLGQSHSKKSEDFSSKDQIKEHYSWSRAHSQAYGAYYLPVNLMKLPLVLEEMRIFGLDLWQEPTNASALPSQQRRVKWLDFGCGPGTALWGLSWWGNQNPGKQMDYIGLDHSKLFLKQASDYSQALAEELQIPLSTQFQRSSKNIIEQLDELNPDVLSFMNSIGEIHEDFEQRALWIQKVIKKLKQISDKKGSPVWMILIEPGSKIPSRDLLSLRDVFIQEEAKIWLPCLNDRSCGALKAPKDWCHTQARCVFPKWLNDIGMHAGLNKESLLFSYLVVSIGAPVKGAIVPPQGFRVVSQRMKQKGRTECYLCGPKSKQKVRVIKSKKNSENEALSEPTYGQVFDRVELDEKGNVLSAVECNVDQEMNAIVFPKLR